MDKLLNVHQASSAIGVSSDTIRRWEKKGLIKGQRTDLNYRLFNIDEIKRLQQQISGQGSGRDFKVLSKKTRSKYSVIELFAGAGGTALGFENAGLNHSLLLDIDKDSTSTLKKNRPDWNVVNADVKAFSFKNLKADIVEGGFPCQAFSHAGKKMGFEDTRGTLFSELARCVKEVRPKIFMGENVKGLLNHDEGRTLKVIIRVLKDLGYRVSYKLLRAQYLDVPQKRERLVIIGVRKDLKIPILFPKERNYTISVREGLKNCPPSPGQEYPKRKKEILKKVPPGGYWRDLPLALQKEYMQASFFMGGGKTGMARRLAWDEPSLTLTCAPAQKQTERCHPEETRPLTVREYARIQTFPDKWQFAGSVASQYKQIGNAVPVNLSYHIGECLIAMLENKPDPKTMDIILPGQETIPEQLKLISTK